MERSELCPRCPLTKEPCTRECAWYLGRYEKCAVAWIGASYAVLTRVEEEQRMAFWERD